MYISNVTNDSDNITPSNYTDYDNVTFNNCTNNENDNKNKSFEYLL